MPSRERHVYLSYGMHRLVNVVTEAEGRPAAVLIRALEPVEGLVLMARRRRASRRGSSRRPGSVVAGARPPRGQTIAETEVCRGPGNLTRAMGITLRHNRLDLCGDALFIEDRGRTVGPIVWFRRIGITSGTEREWRCAVAGSAAVSGRR